MSVSVHDGAAVIKPGQSYVGKQGFTYGAGASAETVGAQNVCMNILPMLAAAVAKAQLSQGHRNHCLHPSFPGRLGIMHRDLPEMIARGYADVAFTWYHLVLYWTRIFPNQFEFVAVSGAEPFFTQIASARVADPLRRRAMKALTSSSSAGQGMCIPDMISPT